KKSLSAIVLFLGVGSAHAVTGQLTVVNHSYVDVACAITRADASNRTINVDHWINIPVARSATIPAVNGLYCEVYGDPSRPLFDLRRGENFCVSVSQYVNPVVGADKFETCRTIGGRFVHFMTVPNTPYYTETIVP